MGKISKQRFQKIKEAGGSKFVPVGDPEEIDRIIGDSSERNEDESNESEFNPVKSENEQQPENGSGIKKTASYDNARLEYMRMQIGPVQNFYTTLGNILLSVTERVAVLEMVVSSNVDSLTKRILELEEKLFVLEKEKQSENTKHE